MIIRIKRNKQIERLKPYLIFFIFYVLFIFITQFFYQDFLFETSIAITSQINKNEKMRNILPIIDLIANFLGSYKIYVILGVLVFNFTNIFKSFILIFSASSIYFVIGILKVVYHAPLMYYSNYDIEKYGIIHPIICGASWGNPSGSAASTTCVYLTLWKIIFDCSRLRYKKKLKFVSLFIISVLILFVNFSKFLIALHSIDQIIFGMFIGFMLFFLIFYVIKMDLNNGENLIKIIKFNFFYYLLIYITLLSFLLIIYFCIPVNEKYIYEANMRKSNCNTYPDNLKFNEDSLLMSSSIFSTLLVIIGMKLEFIYTFNRNELIWRQFNFERESGEEDSFISKFSIGESQWNHNSFFFAFLRFIVCILIHTFLFVPYYLISFNNNLWIVILFKINLPWSFSYLFMFYLDKIILRKLGLVNENVFKNMKTVNFENNNNNSNNFSNSSLL